MRDFTYVNKLLSWDILGAPEVRLEEIAVQEGDEVEVHFKAIRIGPGQIITHSMLDQASLIRAC
jgi:hypothetical protein